MAVTVRSELRLRPDFQSEPERRSKLDNVLHDEPVLVAFHRVHALVVGAVVVGPDCQIEGVLERLSLFLSTSGRRSMSGSCNPSPQSGFGSKKPLHDLQQIDLLVRHLTETMVNGSGRRHRKSWGGPGSSTEVVI
ncbi:hypothetical protein PS2_003271 [Malus domestica]